MIEKTIRENKINGQQLIHISRKDGFRENDYVKVSRNENYFFIKQVFMNKSSGQLLVFVPKNKGMVTEEKVNVEKITF